MSRTPEIEAQLKSIRREVDVRKRSESTNPFVGYCLFDPVHQRILLEHPHNDLENPFEIELPILSTKENLLNNPVAQLVSRLIEGDNVQISMRKIKEGREDEIQRPAIIGYDIALPDERHLLLGLINLDEEYVDKLDNFIASSDTYAWYDVAEFEAMVISAQEQHTPLGQGIAESLQIVTQALALQRELEALPPLATLSSGLRIIPADGSSFYPRGYQEALLTLHKEPSPLAKRLLQVLDFASQQVKEHAGLDEFFYSLTQSNTVVRSWEIRIPGMIADRIELHYNPAEASFSFQVLDKKGEYIEATLYRLESMYLSHPTLLTEIIQFFQTHELLMPEAMVQEAQVMSERIIQLNAAYILDEAFGQANSQVFAQIMRDYKTVYALRPEEVVEQDGEDPIVLSLPHLIAKGSRNKGPYEKIGRLTHEHGFYQSGKRLLAEQYPSLTKFGVYKFLYRLQEEGIVLSQSLLKKTRALLDAWPQPLEYIFNENTDRFETFFFINDKAGATYLVKVASDTSYDDMPDLGSLLHTVTIQEEVGALSQQPRIVHIVKTLNSWNELHGENTDPQAHTSNRQAGGTALQRLSTEEQIPLLSDDAMQQSHIASSLDAIGYDITLEVEL